MNNINKKYHPRCFEIMDLHIDNFNKIKNKDTDKLNFIEIFDNIYKSGPLIIQLFEIFFLNRELLSYFMDISKLNRINRQIETSRIPNDEIANYLKGNINTFNINRFNFNPIKSSSISQTHKYGKDIVKIINKSQIEIWNLDINILKELKNVSSSDIKENHIKVIKKLLGILNYEDIVNNIRGQINLLNEFDNIKLIQNLNIEELIIPEIKFSSSDVLIKSYNYGIRIYEINDKKQIINFKIKTVVLLLKMLNEGIFLLNFNENNILYSEKIYIIDYSLICKVTNDEKHKLKKKINIILRNCKDSYNFDFIKESIFGKNIKSTNDFLENDVEFDEILLQFITAFLLIESGISKKYKINFLKEVFNYLDENKLLELI